MISFKQGLKNHRKQLLLGIVFVLLTSIGYSLLYPGQALSYRLSKDRALTEIEKYSPLNLNLSDRLLIIAPHLDDETLGLGGLIAQARRKKIPVSIVFLTNGDDNLIGANLQFKTGYPTPAQLIKSGELRQQESLQALRTLGVEEKEIYFLGLPDRGLAKLLTAKYTTNPYTAPGTLVNQSPYNLSYISDLPYTGQAAKAALENILTETNPTCIFTSFPEDNHRDHQASSKLLKESLAFLPLKPKVYYYLVHYAGYPRPKGINTNLPLLPPGKLAKEPWEVFNLSSDEASQKQTALQAYSSQLRVPQLGRLMRSLVRTNELVLPSENYID